MNQQKKLARLRSVLRNRSEYKKALHYAITSEWSIDDIQNYIAISGELPPDNVKTIDPQIVLNLLHINRMI